MSTQEDNVVRERRTFPVLQGTDIRSVPWAMIEPHREQAERNHCGQTLERLAQRGGLSAIEMLCALDDDSLDRIYRSRLAKGAANSEAEAQLIARVAEWRATQKDEEGSS